MLPGGEMAARPLHFFWIADCSGSMAGDKIQSLNTAIREAIPEMRRVAQSNPNAQVKVRALKFSTGATWHIAQPTPIEAFQWANLTAGGVTDMGKAFLLVAEQLRVPPMDPRGLPPVLVLISDGYPTDDVNRGLTAIMAEPWGKKAVRLAIGIGGDADYNMLQKFIGNPEIKACQANNPEALVQYIKWASTAAVQAASAPHVQNVQGSAVPASPVLPPTLPAIPAPPPVTGTGGQQSKDVW
jgi:uncharacterized protein YegL